MKVEKFSPKRINTDVTPDAVDRSGDRKLLAGDMIDAVNCRYRDGILRNIKGNVLKAFNLPTGESQVLGSFKNESSNTIFYIIWNQHNDDRVIEYALDTNSFSVVLQGDLKLEKNFPIAQGGVIDGLLLWNDTLNRIRSISISKAKAGGYTVPYSEFEISLATRPPLTEPLITKSTDASLPFNNLTGSTWQVTQRYVYFDNRISTVGPYSQLMWIRPFVDVKTQANNELTVDIAFPVELTGIVKRIEVIAREGNSNNFFVFEEIKNPNLATYQVKFNNFGKKLLLPIEEVNRLYDYIPDRTEGFEVLKDRVFTTLNKTGFDIDDSTFDIQITLQSEPAPGPTLPSPPYNGANPIPETPELRDGSYNNKRYLKGGGSYVVGIIFQNEFGKTSFVKKQKRVVVPFDHKLGYTGNRYYVNCSLTGTPPPGVTKYKFVISDELFYEQYFQSRLWPLLYIREIATEENDNSEFNDGTGRYTWKGKVFYDLFHEIGNPGSARQANVKYIYWQLPQNLPFVPDDSYFVRFSTDFTTEFTPVLGIIGGYLVTEYSRFEAHFKEDGSSPPIDAEATTAPTAGRGGVMAEIFKMKPSSSPERFYEVGATHDISSGAFTITSVNLYGDTYNVRLLFEAEYLYDWVIIARTASSGGVDEVHASFYENMSKQTRQKLFVESPSGLFSSTSALPITAQTSVFNGGAAEQFFFKASLDYQKNASDFGRVHTVFDEERQRDLFNVLGFSNPYVQNTFINGLNTFLAENQYPLPVERSRTRTLKRAGGVMVAIHETQTSSLYIGEGFIRQGRDFILAKTEGVVGDDRKLQGGFGTINPESVHEVYDDLYWWDALKGAVVRYTLAGLYPISNNGMRDYFAKKAKLLFPYRSQVRVVTGFDYANDEFLISFSDAKNQAGSIVVPGETWAFNIKSEEWKQRYSFVPECYSSINLSLISFKGGALWLHHENSIHNNFYGQQYQRKIRFAANFNPSKNKKYLNIHVAGHIASDPQSETFVPVRAYTKEGQESFVPAYEFELDEGKWCAPILKDINTPNVPANQMALRSGDDIVSNYLEVEIVNDRTDESPCSQINIIYKDEEFSI